MADSNATRSRRARLHNSGDHSQCLPNRCAALSAHIKATDAALLPPRGPSELRGSGADLWRSVEPSITNELERTLLLEACRIAERLDQLDRQLHGESWLRFRAKPEHENEITVYVDRVLAEAREQANAFRMIVAELRRTQANAPSKQTAGGAGLSDLTARIAARRSKATS